MKCVVGNATIHIMKTPRDVVPISSDRVVLLMWQWSRENST
jgi:hypothetical protein